MIFNPENYKDKLLFIPLGGTNEIGMNVTLYHYKGKWLMIDCGSSFADEQLPGIDIVVADLKFIEKHKKDLLGLILTHIHEDHLGGIQYIWHHFNCPIYATKFTKNFLKLKLKDNNPLGIFQINEIKQDSQIKLGPFTLEMISMNHSAPEMQAILIKTEQGNILHTGDWKFDHNPVIGSETDYKLLEYYGDIGVLALVCDSTNVFYDGYSGSESDVRDSITNIVSNCKGVVVVTTFASNISRLATLIKVAEKYNRKVILAGRSLNRIMLSATESGYFNNIHSILDENAFGYHKRENIMVIATGCQGEPLAAMSKISLGKHPNINLIKGDTVIFSSKIIPGNDKKIFYLLNNFIKKGISVLTEKDNFVHVSGHPCIEELKLMYSLVKPKVLIPVHGDPIHIHEHAKLARNNGIEQVIEVENGSVVLLDQNHSRIIDKVHSGYLAVDGKFLLAFDSKILKTRRRIKNSGVIFVSIVLDSKYNTLAPPIMLTPGLLDLEEHRDFINLMINKICDSLNVNIIKNMQNEEIENLVRSHIKRYVKQEMNKTPVILVKITKIK